MAAQAIQTTMRRLHSAGLRMTLGSEKGLLATPASAVTAAMRALIVEHKAEIMAYLNDPAPAPAPDRLRAASMALDAVILAAGVTADPDRWCYPHSEAMNTREIDTFAARLALFNRQGLALIRAEALAMQLVERDRCMDLRRTCLECVHLNGSRCNNWEAAGVARSARDAVMPVELVRQFQHCPGFKPAGGAPND